MKKITLDQFYDFKNGYPIPDADVLRWLDEVKDKLLKSEEESTFTFISSGNTIVIGFKYTENDYEFIVADSYKTIDNYEFNNKFKLSDITFK